MSRLHYLDEHEIRSIVESLTRDLFPGTPAFRLAGAEGAARLESALAQPRWPHHRTAQRKAAALHYSLNKNHPYVDGNKRMAVAATDWFLVRNGFWLMTRNDRLVEFALQVADDRLSRDASARWIERRAFRATWTWGRITRWIGALAPDEAADVEDAVTDLVGAVMDPDHPGIAHHRHLAAALDLLQHGAKRRHGSRVASTANLRN